MKSQESNSEVSMKVESEVEEEVRHKSSGYVPGEKSGKWSQDEHMKYIVFIDYNKEKMRSRQKRRSNKFYEEMARFIATRNSLQCRSHHQKLEEKYTHVNKIISLYKSFFSKTAYKHYIEQLDTLTHEKNQENITRYTLSQKVMIDAEVQTDIMDLNCEFRLVNPNLVVIQKRGNIPSRPRGRFETPFFYPPPMYHPVDVSPRTSSSPHFPVPHLGWWSPYPPTGF